MGGQLLRSKEVDWGHSSDEKQESIYSYLRAREAERKLISVPTAHYLHTFVLKNKTTKLSYHL